MKAWRYHAHGRAKDVLHLEDIPQPKLTGPKSVLVKVDYMALNPVDYKMMESAVVGRLAVSRPAIMGKDFSGQVQEIGSEVKRVRPGDKVFGKLKGNEAMKRDSGTATEYVVVEESTVARTQLDLQKMAGLAVAGVTALQSLVEHGGMKKGSRVLINGASGGVGSLAVQIGKAYGSYVAGICSGKNVEFVKGLGADEVIDYKSVDVAEYLSASYKVHPFDFIFDCVGTPAIFYAMHNFTRPSARFISIAGDMSLSGISSLAAMATLPGFLGGGRRKFTFVLTKDSPEYLDELQRLAASGKIRPVVDKVYNRSEMVQAVEYLESGRARGKVIVEMGA